MMFRHMTELEIPQNGTKHLGVSFKETLILERQIFKLLGALKLQTDNKNRLRLVVKDRNVALKSEEILHIHLQSAGCCNN